jgi:hypothetical protein
MRDGSPRHPPGPDTADDGSVPAEPGMERPAMARWRVWLFRLLLRADARSTTPGDIPAERVHHADVPIEL